MKPPKNNNKQHTRKQDEKQQNKAENKTQTVSVKIVTKCWTSNQKPYPIMLRWFIGSIPFDGLNELFPDPASAPQLV